MCECITYVQVHTQSCTCDTNNTYTIMFDAQHVYTLFLHICIRVCAVYECTLHTSCWHTYTCVCTYHTAACKINGNRSDGVSVVIWYKSAVENRWKFPFILQVAVWLPVIYQQTIILHMCIYICIYIYVYIRMYVCIYTPTHWNMHTHIQQKHGKMHKYIQTCLFAAAKTPEMAVCVAVDMPVLDGASLL